MISVAEVTGMEGDVVTMQDLFVSGKKVFARAARCWATLLRPGFVQDSPSAWRLRAFIFLWQCLTCPRLS